VTAEQDRQTPWIKSALTRIGADDLFTTRLHSRDFNASRADYIAMRVRILALVFAAVAPLWIPIDYLVMEGRTFMIIVTLRLMFSVSLLVLGLWQPPRHSLALARFKLGLFIFVPGLFYIGTRVIFGGQMEHEGILMGYSFLPYLMIALLGVAPLTLSEGLAFCFLSIAFFIGAESYFGTLFTVPVIGDIWLLVMLSTIAIWVQLAQLHMLMRLYREATRDHLTGLVNRRVLFSWLEREMQHSRANERPLSVMLFDLDLFKRINDQHGHNVGDQVLQGFAELLRNTLPDKALVGRYGGEEFMVILPDTQLEETRQLGEAVRGGCHQARVRLPESDDYISFTTSTGVAEYSGQERSMELIARVDEGLYKSKAAGRDLVTVV
jgi:diguanylate cyclase (GGDEF)-like protein